MSLTKDNKIKGWYYRKDDITFNEWRDTKEEATKYTKEEATKRLDDIKCTLGRGTYTYTMVYK